MMRFGLVPTPRRKTHKRNTPPRPARRKRISTDARDAPQPVSRQALRTGCGQNRAPRWKWNSRRAAMEPHCVITDEPRKQKSDAERGWKRVQHAYDGIAQDGT